MNCGAFLFSQNITFSRKFDALKKNVPISIINKQAHYFHVLRYNKLGHDMTIERRAKPSAEIIAFTPLKLDSVNAGWFDYEELDYLFFEHKYKLYFIFEKVLNSKKTIYLKVIDTIGKSSGFIELASLERDNAFQDFSFGFKKVANNNVLIIASRTGYNNLRRQVMMLFDIEKRKMKWIKKLPPENAENEFIIDYDVNMENDLIYLHSKNTVIGYETIDKDHVRYEKPLLRLDSLFLVRWGDTLRFPIKRTVASRALSVIKKAFIFPDKRRVLISLQGLKEDSAKGSMREVFLNVNMSIDSNNAAFTTTEFDSLIQRQLTFYDGTYKESFHKTHTLFANHLSKNFLNTFSERVEGNYYKELLFRRTDINTGQVVLQKLIPRKLVFFKNRIRFKNVNEIMLSNSDDEYRIVTLEMPDNFEANPENFVYDKFKKETNLWRSNIVMYIIKDGKLKKELIFRNAGFDLVPLKYDGGDNGKDMVFYVTSGSYEKFIVWKPALQ